jgi:hypothetical protein
VTTNVYKNVSVEQGSMHVDKPELVLFSTDAKFLEKLRPFSVELPYIRYEVGHGPQVTARAHLDALWATLMAGAELFGAAPPFPLYEARVLETPPMQLQRGMPPHGIVGVAVSEHDPKTPEYRLRLIVSALLKAVRDFNSRNPDRIRRVGILPDDLHLRNLNPEVAFRIIREIYEKRG